MSACRDCGASITWVHTDRGKRMPLDAHPVRPYQLTSVAGLFVLRTHGNELYAIAATPAQMPDEPLYRSHFTTCRVAS